MGRRVKSAEEAHANWKSGMSGAGTAYTKGINATTINPMAEAAKPDAMQRYAQNTADAAASGRMASKLMSTDVNSWKQNAATVGAQRLASGAQKGAPKQQAAAQRLAQVWQQQRAAVDAMPKGGYANAAARAAEAIRIMMAAHGKA